MPLDSVTIELSNLLQSSSAREALAPALARVAAALAGRPGEPQAWEPLPITTLGVPLPAEIQSCWIFMLRAGATFGAERHPNSHQRSVALAGSARFELFVDDAWRPSPIGAGETASAISIPPSVWHRITIGPENFASLSFHTVPAEQLIEETPVGDDLAVTKRRLYHA